MMRKVLAVLLLGAVCAGCSKSGGKEGTGAPGNGAAAKAPPLPAAPRGADVKREGFVGVIKAATLDQLKSRTIGDAFANYRYFQRGEWTEGKLPGGDRSVVFCGTLADALLSGADRAQGVSRRTLQVRFVVQGDGAFWIDSITRCEERSGREQQFPVTDPGTVLPMIWDNRKVSF